MNDPRQERYRTEAERGDLRPQFNRHAPAALASLTALPGLEPILLDRLTQLHRPIADASLGVDPALRLSDIGSFLYLIETLRRLAYPNVEDMLCILLDAFSPYEDRSYDELYLWCVVELSRTDGKYVQRFWPEVFRLDANFRSGDWQRSSDLQLVDQPYRLTDLLLYYYEVYTRSPRRQWERHPSVGNWLERLWPELDAEQRATVRRAARDLRTLSRDHAIRSGDTLALLDRRERQDR